MFQILPRRVRAWGAMGALCLSLSLSLSSLLAMTFAQADDIEPFSATPTVSGVAISPAVATAGTPLGAVVTARITDARLITNSVVLQKLNASNAVIGTLGNLNDEGREGDSVGGDKTFTLRTTVLENTPGPLRFRVAAAFQGNRETMVYSMPFTLVVNGTATGVGISSPSNGSYINTPVITLVGSVGDVSAQVKVNGILAPLSGNQFAVSVPLNEGPNTVTAVASNSNGSTTSSSIQVTLDTTAPRIEIYSPAANGTTAQVMATVGGMVNDIVVGTVNPQQATVTVNGVAAEVLNRTFVARNVPLNLGSNQLQAVATDRAGNRTTITSTVQRISSTQAGLTVLSGNGQSGRAGTQLASPLVVKLVNSQGQGMPGKPVVFRVIAQDGLVSPSGNAGTGLSAVAVNTDAQGQARVFFQLGSRSGAGNNLVEASASGVSTTADFSASGQPGPANLVVVDSGNNQAGVVGQPLPLPFIAIVTDTNNNRLANVPVTFAVRDGNGSFGNAGASILQTASDGDGRVAATLVLGPDPGVNNNVVELSFAGNPGYAAAFAATGMVPGPASETRISGVVLDNSNQPIPGATLRLLQITQGNASNIPQEMATAVRTDAQGQFLMQPVPVGIFKLMVDGGTAERPGLWPTLDFDMITVPGQNNVLGMPIYLPELNPNNRVCVNETTGGTVTIPEVPGFALQIAPGAATFPGGSRSGCVFVTLVNMDKVPMSPGFGQQPRFVVTIQPVGTHFNPPARMSIPNVDGLAPRAVTEMYSYDHDLASFVAIGSATVSPDGSTITSDVGVGVIKAGWHCSGPPNSSGSAGTCPTCNKCEGASCVPDNAQTPPQASPTDCKEQYCKNGGVATRSKDSEQLTQACKFCKNGNPENRPNAMSPPNKPSACCFDGEDVDKYDSPLETLIAKCPERKQRKMADGSFRRHEVDGCSFGIPDFPSTNIQDPVSGIFNVPGTGTEFGRFQGVPLADGEEVDNLPCNHHDICYQTCKKEKTSCDDTMKQEMDVVCDRAYPTAECPYSGAEALLKCAIGIPDGGVHQNYFTERAWCAVAASGYRAGLGAFGGSAHSTRQKEFCQCCD